MRHEAASYLSGKSSSLNSMTSQCEFLFQEYEQMRNSCTELQMAYNRTQEEVRELKMQGDERRKFVSEFEGSADKSERDELIKECERVEK